jgi:TAG lipase/steryl ester hydrolase/phospholipase A2/LPA acyltransferase
MSFLSDAILSGGTRLHTVGQKDEWKVIRKSKSYGGLLAPLAQLFRAPVEKLSDTVESQDEGVLGEDADRKQILYLRMKDATSYENWKDAATELDALEGHDAWKEEDDSSEYDAALVAARLRELDDARLSCDVKRMLFLIRTTLSRDLGDMGDLRLYKHSHIGTKKLIERYIDSAEKTLEALLDVSAKQGEDCPLAPGKLLQQMLYTRQSFGRSALLLSGGGTFGMNHIGVVKCLWDAHLLPRIISGASAGSIVSAVLCTKTDEEIPQVLLDFCHGDLDVFEKLGESEGLLAKVVRMFKTGGLFDISHLRRVMRGILGDMTFGEAYNRTRRILNIPVSTSSHFELPRLLNYITSPNVIIWSAVCTSCSVPLVYTKATLLAKDPKTGREVPWDPTPDATWIDGSVDNDLPMTRLAEMWDVNHFIVSQVNPHVVPFLIKEEGLPTTDPQQQQHPTFAPGPSYFGTLMTLVKHEALFRLQVLVDQGVVPSIATKLRSVLSQRYSGDINIFPQISMVDFPRVLSNPTPEYMDGCMLTGQRATWPRLSRIRNHVKIELGLDAAVQKLRARVAFDEASAGLRIDTSGRPVSQGEELRRAKSSNKMTRFEDEREMDRPVLRRSAPTSPFLSRASLRTMHGSAFEQHSYKRTKVSDTHALDSGMLLDAEDSSDRDYFAEIDSDSMDEHSSPSPITSPSVQGPTLWPSSTHAPYLFAAQDSLPGAVEAVRASTCTAEDWRQGKRLNLSMTTAGQDAPTPGLASSVSREPGSGRAFALDLSGTRSMLLRRKSFGKDGS